MRALATTCLALAVTAVPTAARADLDAQPYAGISVEQLYDSNVQNDAGGDGVTRITPRLGFFVDGPRLKLDLDYRVGFHEYDQGTLGSTINHRAALQGRALVTPRFEIDSKIVFIDAADPILLERAGVAVPQGGFEDLEANLGASYRVTRRFTVEGNYMYRRSRFDLANEPGQLAVDGDEHRVDLAGDYRLTRQLTLRGIARGQHFVTFGEAETLGDAVGGGPGIDYSFTQATVMRLQAGPLWFSATDPTWFAVAQLVHRGERSRWSVTALRDLYGGTSASEAVWSESINLTGVFRLTRDLELRLRGGAYRNGNPSVSQEDANVSGLVGRVDLGWSVFRDNARIELYGEHRAQDANGGLAFGDVNRTVVGIRLVLVAGVDLLSLGEFQ